MPVYKSGVEDSIKSSLLTTIGDIIAASAVSTPARVAAPASGQVFTGQGAGVLPAWAAAATGAVTRAGGNTVEATTTSTSQVDLLTTSSLSIATGGVPVKVVAGHRKTNQAYAYKIGFKMNTTEVLLIQTISNTSAIVDGGGFIAQFSTFQTSYDLNSIILLWTSTVPADAVFENAGYALPNATVTSVIITAASGNAAQTVGADEMHVYTYSVS